MRKKEMLQFALKGVRGELNHAPSQKIRGGSGMGPVKSRGWGRNRIHVWEEKL